jgi:hypothetical protein
MRKGKKIRQEVWWHYEYIMLTKTGYIIDETGFPASETSKRDLNLAICFYEPWEEYIE